jgi:hypothetical protein
VNRGKAERDINPHLSTPIIVHTIQQLFQAKYGELLASGKCSQDELVDTLLHLLFNGIATDQVHKRARGLGKENQPRSQRQIAGIGNRFQPWVG